MIFFPLMVAITLFLLFLAGFLIGNKLWEWVSISDIDERIAALMNRHRDEPLDRLTGRERDVLSLMAQGRSNGAIAGELFVTEKAVAKHINSIFTKLDLPVDVDDNRRVLAVLAWLRV